MIKHKYLFLICFFSQNCFSNDLDSSVNLPSFSAYLDTSYNYLANSNQFTSLAYDRVFDLNPHGPTLHQAAFTVAHQPKEGLGGLLNIIAGRDAVILQPYGWSNLNHGKNLS